MEKDYIGGSGVRVDMQLSELLREIVTYINLVLNYIFSKPSSSL